MIWSRFGARLWLGVCLLSWAAALWGGQGPFLRPALRVLGEAEGLHDMTVYGVAQGPDGRLWVGTQNGVAVFTGQRFQKVVFPGPHLPSVVRSILATRDGSLWIATDNLGIFRRRGDAWTHYGEAEGLPASRVNSLCEWVRDGQAELYAGTVKGLARLAGERWVPVAPGQGVPAQSWVWKVKVGPSGELGVAARGWVGLQRGTGWEVHLEKEGLPGPDVNDLEWVEGPAGPLLCVSIWNKGLHQWQGKRWVPFPQGPHSVNPTGLLRTRDPLGGEVLWFSTFNDGLYWHWRGEWHHLDVASGLPGNGVYSLTAGGKPTVWAGTRSEGLVGVDLGGWATLAPNAGMPRGEVTAVLPTVEAQGGGAVVWAGTPQGIYRGESGIWALERVDGTGPDYVNAFAESGPPGHGTLWVGTMRGLLKRERGRWTRLDPRSSTGDAQVFSLLPTRDARGGEVLWVGTQEGLAVLRNGSWQVFGPAQGLPGSYLMGLAEAPCPGGERDLWIVTRGNGVGRYHRGRWHAEQAGLEGLPGLVVSSVVAAAGPDGSHWLWAGSVGGGLLRRALDVPAASWTLFPPGHFPGILANRITALRTDVTGHLFAATESGIAEFRLGPGGTLTLDRLFTKGDGLPSHAATAGTLAWDQEGRLWFGSSRGLARFTPGVEPPLPPLPDVLVDRDLPGGGFGALGDALRLGHRANRLKVRFGLPILHRMEDVRFRSQLVGVEAEPTPWTPEAMRDFSALPPGHLILRVWATDYAGRTTPPREIHLEVQAPPWRRPWAVALYVAVGGLAFWGLLALRTGLLHQHNRRLQAQVRQATAALEAARDDLELRVEARTRDLARALARAESADQAKSAFLHRMSHELRTPLNHMLLYTQVLEAEWPEVAGEATADEFQAIRRAGRELEGIIADILDFSALESGDLALASQPFAPAEVAAHVADVFRARIEGKGLALEVIVDPEAPREVVGDPHRLAQVLKNLVSNALKFTDTGAVRLRVVARPGGVLRFEVEDTGPGLSPEAEARIFKGFEQEEGALTRAHGGTGLGLAIAHRLVVLMGGRLGFEPGDVRGTLFWVDLALPPA